MLSSIIFFWESLKEHKGHSSPKCYWGCAWRGSATPQGVGLLRAVLAGQPLLAEGSQLSLAHKDWVLFSLFWYVVSKDNSHKARGNITCISWVRVMSGAFSLNSVLETSESLGWDLSCKQSCWCWLCRWEERESGLWLGEASSPWWSEPWVPSEVQQAGFLMKELFEHSFLSSVSRILLTFKAKLYFMPLGSSNILPSCTGESGKQLLTLSSPILRPFRGGCVSMCVQTLPSSWAELCAQEPLAAGGLLFPAAIQPARPNLFVH